MLQEVSSYQVSPIWQREGIYKHDNAREKCTKMHTKKDFFTRKCAGEKMRRSANKKRIRLHDTGAGDELRANKGKIEV